MASAHQEKHRAECEAEEKRTREVVVVQNFRLENLAGIKHNHGLLANVLEVDAEFCGDALTRICRDHSHAPSESGGSSSKPPVPNAVLHDT